MLKKRFFKTKDEVEVTFELDKDQWDSIHIAGDFNNWQPEPMEDTRAYEGSLHFVQGTYWYR